MTARERLAERLHRFGFRFGDDQLQVAEHLLARRGCAPDDISDVVLMTICVEAYGQPDADLPAWI